LPPFMAQVFTSIDGPPGLAIALQAATRSS